jgi:hypothetical protein
MSFQFSLFAPFVPRRTVVTPGRLYAMMSAEFRKSRVAGHASCIMPMVCARERVQRSEPAWGIQSMTSQCEACTRIAQGIAQRHGRLYEMHDPIGSTYEPTRATTRAHPSDDARLFGT